MSYIFKKGDIVRVKKVVGVAGYNIPNFIKGGKLGEADVEKVSFQQMVDEF